MNNSITYKRIKLKGWVIILFGGFHVWMIFAYIHQWGSRPLPLSGLFIMSAIWIFIYLVIGWRKVVIDDKSVIFWQFLPLYNKIEIVQIKEVSVVNVSIMNVMYWSMGMGMMLNDAKMGMGMKFPEQFSFDFVKQTVIIKLKNGKSYQIAIKDAERIREEIEFNIKQI